MKTAHMFHHNDWDGKIPTQKEITTGQIIDKVEPLQLTFEF